MEADSMACECGSPWGEVIDNKLVCQKCGRTKEVRITYEQLLAENRELKETIRRINNEKRYHPRE